MSRKRVTVPASDPARVRSFDVTTRTKGEATIATITPVGDHAETAAAAGLRPPPEVFDITADLVSELAKAPKARRRKR